MAVKKRTVTGYARWWIDRILVRGDGSSLRYRKVAKDQTNKRAAEAEEQRLVEYWAQHGCLPTADNSGAHAVAATHVVTPTWDDAVRVYERDGLPHLKPSTRARHLDRLYGPWMKHWQGVRLHSIRYPAIEAWDLRMKTGGLAPSTRRNYHLLVRVVLKAVGPRGGEPGLMLDRLPEYPPLPRVGRTTVETVSTEELQRLLRECKHQGLRVAIALGAYAGLRSGEARALTRADIDLDKRTIAVTKSIGATEVTRTKSGHDRVIPISNHLLAILEPHITKMRPKDIITRNSVGNAWGDVGLSVAYRRLAKRLGLKSTKYHSLRHRFATQLFGQARADAVTVQHLMGHQSLSVTQRYAHHSHERAVVAIAAME